MMTRGEIRRNMRLLGRQFNGSDASLDPFGEDFCIIEAANKVARDSDCLVGRRYLDLTEDISEYCAPDIYRLVNVHFKDPETLEWVELRQEQFNNYRLLRLRNLDPGTPECFVTYGTNRVGLYPAPDTTLTDSLLIEGYCIPGDYWLYDENGNPSDPDEDDECPLPSWAHSAVVYGALMLRAEQLRDDKGLVIFTNRYNDLIGLVESNAATYHTRAGRM